MRAALHVLRPLTRCFPVWHKLREGLYRLRRLARFSAIFVAYRAAPDAFSASSAQVACP